MRSQTSQIAPHSSSRPLPEALAVPVAKSQVAPPQKPQRANSFYAEADFEDAPPSAAAQDDAYSKDPEEYAEAPQGSTDNCVLEEQDQQQPEDNQYHHQRKNSYNTQHVEPGFSAEALIRPVAALIQLDLAGELIYFRDRFADLQQGQPGFKQERSALLELERSTEALLTSRKALTEKQRQLVLLHINDGRRPNLQAEVVQLTTECRAMEHQWRIGKETYHREYVVAAAKAAAAAAAKANAELKGFFCKSTVVFASPDTSPKPQYHGGSPGPGALGGNVQADQLICPSSDAYAIRIASCPQGDCQQNYCVGGGPAKVPERLPSGNGLYCGKTLNAQYGGGSGGDGRGQANLDAFGDSTSAFGGGLGGGLGGGSGGSGGSGGGGGGRPPQGEYVRNNLYYFIGSYGVNLGPCPYRCINAGPGTPDYCAASTSQY
ncbi:hypothetical protein BGZ47_008133 [Haplosporangium gracile]|nr:hypothetical protein BGZ47_008133 [Haplosporangium gracile]